MSLAHIIGMMPKPAGGGGGGGAAAPPVFANNSADVYNGTLSWSHTVAAGSNRLMLAFFALRSDDETMTAVTYDGVAMTKLTHVDYGSGSLRTEVWYLVAPNVGAHNIIGTVSGSVTANQAGATIVLTNVDQSDPFGALQTASQETGGGTSITTNITTEQANSLLVDFVMHRNDLDITPGGSQTSRVGDNNASNTIYEVSTQPAPTAGNYSCSWSDGADHSWRHTVIEVKGI